MQISESIFKFFILSLVIVLSTCEECPPYSVEKHSSCQHTKSEEVNYGRRKVTLTYFILDHEGKCVKHVWTGMVVCRSRTKTPLVKSTTLSDDIVLDKKPAQDIRLLWQKEVFKSAPENTLNVEDDTTDIKLKLLDVSHKWTTEVNDGVSEKSNHDSRSHISYLKRECQQRNFSILHSHCNPETGRARKRILSHRFLESTKRCVQEKREITTDCSHQDLVSAGQRHRCRQDAAMTKILCPKSTSLASVLIHMQIKRINPKSFTVECVNVTKAVFTRDCRIEEENALVNNISKNNSKSAPKMDDFVCRQPYYYKTPCDKSSMSYTYIYKFQPHGIQCIPKLTEIKSFKCENKDDHDTNAIDSSESDSGCPIRQIVKKETCLNGMKIVHMIVHRRLEYDAHCQPHSAVSLIPCGYEHDISTSGNVRLKDCPEKSAKKGRCKDGLIDVITTYFVWSKDLNRCVRKLEITTESCGDIAVKNKKCPDDPPVKKGPCEDGFQVNTVYSFVSKEDGSCEKTSNTITLSCQTEEKSCPPKTEKVDTDCKSGIQKWSIKYYVFNEEKKRCIGKFKYEERSCSVSDDCPSPRILEPGPCKDGKRKILVEHYEYNSIESKCEAQTDYIIKKCMSPKLGIAKVVRKADKTKKLCPEPQYHQKKCDTDGYRTVVKIYREYEEHSKKCVRKVELQTEQCAKFVKTDCPLSETVESGPCKDGFRNDIVFGFVRNDDGICEKSTFHVVKSCEDKKHECKPLKKKKLSECEADGLEQWLITYYVYNEEKHRCIRKLEIKENICEKAGKICPTPRVLEPGPCEDQVQTIFVEHYEYDENLEKCIPKKDLLKKDCGSRKNKPSEEGEHHAKNHFECPEPQYNQHPCESDGYRTVTKKYYEYSSHLERCISKLKTEKEKCAKFLKDSCDEDEVVETGPCKDGYQDNMVYKYERTESGDCMRKESHVTQKCAEAKTTDESTDEMTK